MATKLYNLNTDYQALINAEKAKGAAASQTDIDKWTAARQTKIADNPSMQSQWKLSNLAESQKSTLATPTFREYITGGGLTGDKKYELSNIGSTPTINGIAVDPKAYGMQLVNGSWTGTQDQYNNLLAPLDKLNANQATSKQSLVPTTQDTPYSSALNDQLMRLMSYTPFNYDSTQDAALKTAQTQASNTAIEAVQKAAARRNMLYSDSTNNAAAQAAAQAAINLVPTYRQQALDQYNTNLGAEQQKLSNLQLLDETRYGRGQDTFANKVVEAGLTGNWGDLRTMDGSNIDMAKEQQSWNQMYQNKTFDYQKTRDTVSDLQFGQQYQLELDNFLWNKSANNPNVQRQILENKVLDTELDYLAPAKQAELAKLWQDVEAGKISMDTAKKNIEALQAEIENTKANTGLTKANTTATKEKTSQLKNQGTSSTASTLTYKEADTTFVNKVAGSSAIKSNSKEQKKKAAAEFLRLYNSGVSPAFLYQLSIKYSFDLPDDIEKTLT